MGKRSATTNRKIGLGRERRGQQELIPQLRGQIRVLTVRVRELEVLLAAAMVRLGSYGGGATGGDGGGTAGSDGGGTAGGPVTGATSGTQSASDAKVEELRRKAAAKRLAKARRIEARRLAQGEQPKPHRRGRRSMRGPIEVDETRVVDVEPSDLPADAKPNGFITRYFRGVKLVRNNVKVLLREYISATQGRIVAKVPAGYTGEFTPETRALVLSLSTAGLSEPKIKELFGDCGVSISAGGVNGMLLRQAEELLQEQRAAHRAGMEHSPEVGIDGTHSTCDGDTRVCHVIGNAAFTTYATTQHKDRLSVISALAGESVRFGVDAAALEHPDLGVASREILRRVDKGELVMADADPVLVELAGKLRSDSLDTTEMDDFVARVLPAASAETLRTVREASATAWLRALIALPLVMLTDGGTNYHGILLLLQLCWIHMLRPLSELEVSDESTRVLGEGWKLYARIQRFRQAPDPDEATRIRLEFDHVFDPSRCERTDVRKRVTATAAHKHSLLTVLDHPYVPPENNGQERSARARVRKRDISFGPRSERGLRALDTLQSVTATLRKLRISPHRFFADRISRANAIPRLDVLVAAECIRVYGPLARQ